MSDEKSVPVPTPIQTFIDATNRGDTETFVAVFADDAYLNDWGKEFHGRDGVRSWNDTDNIGVQSHFELVDIVPVAESGTYLATLTVTGNGYNGTGPMSFTLDGDQIARLEIGP